MGGTFRSHSSIAKGFSWRPLSTKRRAISPKRRGSWASPPAASTTKSGNTACPSKSRINSCSTSLEVWSLPPHPGGRFIPEKERGGQKAFSRLTPGARMPGAFVDVLKDRAIRRFHAMVFPRCGRNQKPFDRPVEADSWRPVNDPIMQPICSSPHSSLSRTPRLGRDAGDRANDWAPYPRGRQGFLCPAEGDSDLPRVRGASQEPVRRGLGSIRLGEKKHPLHSRYLSDGVAALRAENAGAQGRRLRRHDDPAGRDAHVHRASGQTGPGGVPSSQTARLQPHLSRGERAGRDRKSTRLNSSHLVISYAVFCLKKKKKKKNTRECKT